MPANKGEAANRNDVIISTSDILINLDFTFMGGATVRKNKLSLPADVIYMDLEDTTKKTVVQGPPLSWFVTNVELKA